MKIRATLLSLFVFLFAIANAQWRDVYTCDTQLISKIKFYDKKNGFAIGRWWYGGTDGPVMGFSNDAGETWKVQKTSNWIHNFCYADSLTLFAGFANSAHIFKSEDGGHGWSALPVKTGYGFSDIFFLSPDTGYWVASDTFARTFDGGITCQKFALNEPVLKKVIFLNSQTGFILAQDDIYKTEDGGENWRVVFDSSYMIHDISFPNEKVGYATNLGNFIVKSTDGGETWKVMDTCTVPLIKEFFFLNDSVGYGMWYGGTFFKTTNGAESWTPLVSIPTTFYTFWFFDEQTGIIGYDMHISKMDNGGEPMVFWQKKCGIVSVDTETISPNPANDYINIKINIVRTLNYEPPEDPFVLAQLLDISGRLCYEQKFFPISVYGNEMFYFGQLNYKYDQNIDIRSLNSGMYILKISTWHGNTSKRKIVIVH